MVKEQLTQLWLSDDDIKLFLKFQERYHLIAHLLGYIESLKVMDLNNTNISLDIDDKGIVKHMAITKHFRP